MNTLYQNANGKEYKILAMVGDIGLLESEEEFVTPYILAVGFSPYVSSWGDGVYFRTIEEAKEEFNKRVNL